VCADVGLVAGAEAGAAVADAANAAPHSWQNFTPAGLTLPHPAQVISDFSAAPHSPQNFTPSGFVFPHAWQFILFAPGDGPDFVVAGEAF
jgi:hypothetical protein